MMSDKSFFLIAGEPSGDTLGAALIKGLREKWPNAKIQGIGGPKMEKAGGFRSLFPLSWLSHMGFAALLKRLFFFYA